MLSKDFINELQTKDLSFIASKWLIEKIPHIFEENLEEYISWKEQLSRSLGVDSRAISIIGSACAGFSLNPNKNFKPYGQESDIDAAIISHHHFDLAWHELRNLGARKYTFTTPQQKSIDDHKKFYIFEGTIATDKILSIFSFGKEWTLALSEMAQIYPSEGKDIKLRIYNDFESLRAYHMNNLRNLRAQSCEGEKDE